MNTIDGYKKVVSSSFVYKDNISAETTATLFEGNITVKYDNMVYSPCLIIALHHNPKEYALSVISRFGIKIECDVEMSVLADFFWFAFTYEVYTMIELVRVEKIISVYSLIQYIIVDPEDWNPSWKTKFYDCNYTTLHAFYGYYSTLLKTSNKPPSSFVEDSLSNLKILNLRFDVYSYDSLTSLADKLGIIYGMKSVYEFDDRVKFILTRDEIFRSLRNYHFVLSKDKYLLLKGFSVTEDYSNYEVKQYLRCMSDYQLSHIFEIFSWKNRSHSIELIDKSYIENSWRIGRGKYILNMNEETTDLDLYSEIVDKIVSNKGSYYNTLQLAMNEDPILSYGTHAYHIGILCSDLVTSCKMAVEDDVDFFSPVENIKCGMDRIITMSQADELKKLIKNYKSYNKNIAELYDFLKTYVDIFRIYKADIVKLVNSQSQEVICDIMTYCCFCITLSSWIRFWKGPGYDVIYDHDEEKAKSGYKDSENKVDFDTRNQNVYDEFVWFNEWLQKLCSRSQEIIKKDILKVRYKGQSITVSTNKISLYKLLINASRGEHCILDTSDICVWSILMLIPSFANFNDFFINYTNLRYNKSFTIDPEKFARTYNFDAMRDGDEMGCGIQ